MITVVSIPFTSSTIRLARRLFRDSVKFSIYTSLPSFSRLRSIISATTKKDRFAKTCYDLSSSANAVSVRYQELIEFVFYLVCSIRFVSTQNSEKIYSNPESKAILLLHSGLVSEQNIRRSKAKIYNCHTGWLPRDRGISSFDRALERGLPPALSLHSIDPAIDRGELLFRATIPWRRESSITELRSQLAFYREAVFHDLVLSLDHLNSHLCIDGEQLGPLASKERLDEKIVDQLLARGVYEQPCTKQSVFKTPEFNSICQRLSPDI